MEDLFLGHLQVTFITSMFFKQFHHIFINLFPPYTGIQHLSVAKVNVIFLNKGIHNAYKYYVEILWIRMFSSPKANVKVFRLCSYNISNETF